jgi:alpha-L-fucosidase 2
VKGLRARGGFEIDIDWKNGTLAHATIRSITGTSCRIRYRDKVMPLNLRRGAAKQIEI